VAVRFGQKKVVVCLNQEDILLEQTFDMSGGPMNSNTASTGWTSWSVMSGLIFFGVGLLIALFNCATDLQQLQAELPDAPVYFGSETIALHGHSQIQFQYAAPQQ
jgi:hypothetical protein